MCSLGWGSLCVLGRVVLASLKSSALENLIWSFRFPPEACPSSCLFCFLWRMSIRRESPGWLSSSEGIRRGRWREVMQSSKIAYEYWMRFRIFPLSLQTLTFFFFPEKIFTPLHQTTFLICRNQKRKYSQ